jgi:hypothetical protein
MSTVINLREACAALPLPEPWEPGHVYARRPNEGKVSANYHPDTGDVSVSVVHQMGVCAGHASDYLVSLTAQPSKIVEVVDALADKLAEHSPAHLRQLVTLLTAKLYATDPTPTAG